MGVIIPKELVIRHRQSVIVAELVLKIFTGMRVVYPRRRNLNAQLDATLIASKIRSNDGNGGEPLAIGDIGKILSMPRSNVKRATETLIKIGMIQKDANGGFVGNMDWLAKNRDADFFNEMVAAILNAATELQATFNIGT